MTDDQNKNDIYVRAYAKRIVNATPNKRKGNETTEHEEPRWLDYALIFDCETRITADQTLTFGFWRFCELRSGKYVPLEEGILHDDGLSRKELNVLRKYARPTEPETADDGCECLCLYSRSKFIDEVFGMAIQAKAFIVGFNLPFDLSRIAMDWNTAQNRGWTLIMKQWRNPETGTVEPDESFPRVVIKALNSKASIIGSTRPPMSLRRSEGKPAKLWPRGRFLDVRTLLWALRNKSYSLKTACEKFETEHQKIDHKPTGNATLEEIEYARNDVPCTVDVLNAAKREFDLHPIAPGPDRMFSPASVAKSYLEELHISHPSEKVKDADAAYGVFMQSYFGGRAECRIRSWEVPVCLVDFMSQYPTVNELLDNWDVLIAKNVTFPDATKEVRQLLSWVTLEGCFDRKLWPQFKFFALVRPDRDILPVRTVYNGTTQNIGINYLTSKEPIWFAGPDIIASILLTGKVPHIEKAIRVMPHGKQAGLGSTSLRGMVNVDAKTHSFFKHVIEQRAAHESNPALHYWLKILANSGSYGLFVELNPNESDAKLRVFSGKEPFETTSDVVEEPGKWFAPHIASLITSGGRLLLAMLEKCIADAGGTYLFCDTDSAAIISAKHRQRVTMPDGAEPITALSWDEVQSIVDRFEPLNPYDRKLVPGSILKIHKLNWDRNKQRRQLFGYSIAAKRYTLYTKTQNDIEIIEPKAHGLGYFYPPKDSPEGWGHETPQWIFEAWDWIMRGVLGLEHTKPAWFGLPVMMRLTLSTPHHALRNVAKGPLTRPNNFMMLPQICRFGYPQNVDPNKFTLITPFSSERDQWMHSKCINIHDYKSPVYELTDDYDGCRALAKNFFMLLDSYQNHPETKSLGPDGKKCEFDTQGLLRRAHIVANWPPIYIGKESDRHWEEGEDLSLLEFKAMEYRQKGNAVANAEQLARIAKVPKREFMRRGVNQHTLEKISNREPVRAIKLANVIKVLQQWESEQYRKP
jgi:hypothetical protein